MFDFDRNHKSRVVKVNNVFVYLQLDIIVLLSYHSRSLEPVTEGSQKYYKSWRLQLHGRSGT